MTKDNLDKTFNITPEVVEEKKSIERSTPPPDRLTKDDITRDYEYTRGNLYSIIEKGQEASDGILEIAQESEMPRAYEVAGQLIKSVSDATDKLIDLQKKLKDVNTDKFRISITKSLKNLSAQIIDDKERKTLVSASSIEKEVRTKKVKKMDKSTLIGEILAKRAKEKNIVDVYFDRGEHKYHGRVKVFAETLKKWINQL